MKRIFGYRIPSHNHNKLPQYKIPKGEFYILEVIYFKWNFHQPYTIHLSDQNGFPNYLLRIL